jgi:hypothetical protein
MSRTRAVSIDDASITPPAGPISHINGSHRRSVHRRVSLAQPGRQVLGQTGSGLL